jgi:hypothetical protein
MWICIFVRTWSEKKAAEKMAEHIGDTGSARRYSEIFYEASKRADK